MGCFALFKNEYEFVLVSIEGALSRGGFGPHAYIFKFVKNSRSGRKQFPGMPPVHACVGDAAIGAVNCTSTQCLLQERDKLVGRHLARRMGEFTMFYPTPATYMSGDTDIVRRV